MEIMRTRDGNFNFSGVLQGLYGNFRCEMCSEIQLNISYIYIIENLKYAGLLEKDFPRICCSCYGLVNGEAFDLEQIPMVNLFRYSLECEAHTITRIVHLNVLKKRNRKGYDFMIKILKETYGFELC